MKKNKQVRILYSLKFIEFGLLGFGAYYGAAFGTKANPMIFFGVYSLLFIITILDLRYINIKRNNVNLLVRHFYEQNYFDPENDVRITIHKKINEKCYKQYIDYYPSGATMGRVQQIEKGIVRYAFTQAQGEFTENFATNEEKLEKLVSIYNFRQDEAKEQVKDGERSYYCCPIMDDVKVWGVLYMKAKKPFTFPEQAKVEGSEISKNTKALVKLIENEIA